MKKLQMIALAAALSVTGAHAAVAESTVSNSAGSWTVGSTVSYLGSTYTVIAIVAGVATLAVVAAHNGGSSGTTGTIQATVPQT